LVVLRIPNAAGRFCVSSEDMEESYVGPLPEEKFWFSILPPELIETLLTMLDTLSIKMLIESGVVEQKVLKKSVSSEVWAGLIRRRTHGGGGVLVLGEVKNLVAILKFLKPEDPGSFLLPILSHICKSFPAEMYEAVSLNRPGHEDPRRVSLEGFLLLEEAESSFGTSIQSIQKIGVGVLDEPHLSALSSRVVRQENPVASIFIGEVKLGGGLQSAQAFSILLQADRVDVRFLEVSEAIGEEGWRILAKAITPGILLGVISVTRDGLAQGKREDFKVLFDAGCLFRIFKTLEDLQEDNWQQASLFVDQVDDNWSQVERVLDMAEQELGEEKERRRNGGV